ncbi:MAG: ferritin-like domain-containing protein [Pseudomonadota bacterium]|nr:ferritin-like domain-containing protein [Pseudomonadota bacterium]
MTDTLYDAALTVLNTACPHEKAEKTQAFAARWFADDSLLIGQGDQLPERPARPDKPELLHPSKMPKRLKGGSLRNKISLLHALAHIELNAIDLAWDIMARFAHYAAENDKQGFSLPREFYSDWMKVASDEAKHFLMLSSRLSDLDAAYGDLPAHDGLWESADRTAHDFAARLAIVPMVLEARGLDVTPHMITSMKNQEDFETADMLQIIHDDEITHVRAGTVWFEAWCEYHDKTVDETWQDLVRTYFNGVLKKPFNHDSREKAEMLRHWYEPLAEEMERLATDGKL